MVKDGLKHLADDLFMSESRKPGDKIPEDSCLKIAQWLVTHVSEIGVRQTREQLRYLRFDGIDCLGGVLLSKSQMERVIMFYDERLPHFGLKRYFNRIRFNKIYKKL